MALFEGEQNSEYGNLIAIDGFNALRYLSVNVITQSFVWSYNPCDALRFSRTVDAQNILAALNWPVLTSSRPRVVEHCFVYDEKDESNE